MKSLTNKTKNYRNWLITLSITFTCLTGIFLYVVLTGNISPKIANSGNFSFGDDINIEINNNQSSCFSQTFTGSFLPNSKIKEKIVLNTNNTFQDSYVRVKAATLNDNNEIIEFNFENNSNWTKKDDGFYYLKTKMEKDSTVKLCETILTPTNCLNFNNNKTYIFTLTVETIPFDKLYLTNLWKVNSLE